ncbi:MAG: tripartite tricarboxylate transporter substrate binding protein [Desulfarculus sp.]|jgi:tripartite-type tricarboxylate transporter receptor subunit TctC|nr:MAG: tripartite tricarboxylate transporter substrate binding protein [Desulfarculus sp.]
MKRTLLFTLALVLAGGLVALPAIRALAGGFPDKPIQLIYPWPAGSGGDIASRLLAEAAGKQLGVPVKVINKAGGQGTIGAAEVAQAKPDGYVLGSLPIGPALTQPIFAKGLPYKTSDLVPICQFTYLPMVLIANPKTPYKNLKEFLAYAKKNSGQVKYGHPGVGSVPYLAMKALEQYGGFTMIGVPYKGLRPGVTAVVGGHVDAAPAVLAPALKLAQGGKIKILALFATKRMGLAPQVPTVEEFGIKTYPQVWTGVFAPKGLAADVLAKLRESFAKACANDGFNKAMAKAKQPVAYLDAKAFAAKIAADQKYFRTFAAEQKK